MGGQYYRYLYRFCKFYTTLYKILDLFSLTRMYIEKSHIPVTTQQTQLLKFVTVPVESIYNSVYNLNL